MVNSPYHSVARWLAELLEPVRKLLSTHSLKDKFDFVNTINGLNVSNKLMFSLDITSLFTNVPLVETSKFVIKYLTDNNLNVRIPLETLQELPFRCTFNVQFLFDGAIYRQKDGVAMGSPFGPLLADFFMAMFESNQLKGIINSLHTYCRYVDDIFCLADSDCQIDTLLDQFNTAHSSIQFTVQLEVDNQMPLLDVLLTRGKDGSVRR